jgi:hypothetical protein
MSGRYFCFCSSVPNFMITGATMVAPKGSMRGAPARDISRSKMYFCEGVQSGPPHSAGQLGTAQPFFASRCCHSTCSSFDR